MMERFSKDSIKQYWVNDGPKLVFLTLYMAANIVVFLYSFLTYMDTAAFTLVSYGVCFAKAGAAMIKLNGACILIPVLRNFLSWVRGTWVNTYIPIDKNIIFHKFLAWLILAGTCIHCVAHFYNYYHLSQIPVPVARAVFGLDFTPSITYLSFQTLPGLTGHFALMAMILMYTTAVETIRRPNFELFWYTHHLFVIFYALICVHGLTNWFGKAEFWCWVVGPVFLYFIERIVRFFRGKQTTMLLMAKQHPSRVIELRMKKATFNYKPGQYLYLNCPYIAKNEWHPFTITSSPDEDFVSVHINAVGNWTGRITALLNPEKKLGITQQDVLEAPDGSKILAIDGPFGAASEEVFGFNIVMLVGAGIGVTPFASILKHIRSELKKFSSKPPISKVYFFWICRDKNSFEWFSSMLVSLEQENVNNFLEINTYLTGGLSPDEVRDVMYDSENQQDQITGLASPTHFGRPKWSDIFQKMAATHPGERVGVFYCGPRILSKQLYKNCRRYTSSACKFQYHKENF